MGLVIDPAVYLIYSLIAVFFVKYCGEIVVAYSLFELVVYRDVVLLNNVESVRDKNYPCTI